MHELEGQAFDLRGGLGAASDQQRSSGGEDVRGRAAIALKQLGVGRVDRRDGRELGDGLAQVLVQRLVAIELADGREELGEADVDLGRVALDVHRVADRLERLEQSFCRVSGSCSEDDARLRMATSNESSHACSRDGAASSSAWTNLCASSSGDVVASSLSPCGSGSTATYGSSAGSGRSASSRRTLLRIGRDEAGGARLRLGLLGLLGGLARGLLGLVGAVGCEVSRVILRATRRARRSSEVRAPADARRARGRSRSPPRPLWRRPDAHGPCPPTRAA